MRESECKGCGKTIKWLKNKAGKWIPLDPRPPVYEVKRDFTGEQFADLMTDDQAMVSHFATCPKANQFSGRNKNSS